MRWKIETFQKILKSGCRAEDSKLRTPPRCLVWVNTKQPNGGIRLLEVAGRSVRYSCLGLRGEATASPSRRWECGSRAFGRFPRPAISTVDFGAKYASSPVAGKL